MKQSPFIKSRFKRIEGDFYPTIDSRCIQALTESVIVRGKIVDPCAPDGSGIVDALRKLKFKARCESDAFKKRIECDWIITNPPYQRGLVNKIIAAQIARLRDPFGENGHGVSAVAVLLRSTFDHAKSYKYLFDDCEFYSGQIKLTFRPRWIADSKGSPIHNYVWHIWGEKRNGIYPWVKYW